MAGGKLKVKGQRLKSAEKPGEAGLAAEGVGVPKWHEAGAGEEKLDPAEERMLDWILKGIVIFILGWLGLSVLLVIGGYFGMWK